MISLMISSLSVFFPCFNEGANIEKTVKKALPVLDKNFKTWEMILIDDGSTDSTGKIIDNLSKSDPRIKAIHHPKNKGYGAALKSGFYNSIYPWIAFTDADGQFDFSEITSFFSKQKETGADLVIGYYRKRQVSVIRKLNTFIWQVAVNILFGLKVHDIDCGFKLISKKVFDTIPPLQSERGAFISSEFLIMAQKSGFKIVEIPVYHYPRVEGHGTGADINVIIKSFIDLFKLWLKMPSPVSK
jgi:glycosyltransferase involved in cell wall biosynthesis